MTTPKTGKGGGGGGGSWSTRRGRKDEMPVVIEPTASNKDIDDINNNNNNGNNNTAVVQKTGVGVSRLPSIKERRPSVQKKARTASVTEVSSDSSTVATATTATTTPSSTTTTTTTTTTILQRQESTSTTTTSTPTPTIQRRSSVNQGLGQKVSRPTFAGIGRRVSSMVRARMAFQSRRKSVATTAEEINHMEAIHEMPRNPRFTTFLSAEAQYAMMKGYEDMLYEKIAKTNPESRLVLKRTKTPFHKKVSIVDNESKEQGGRGEKNRTGGNNPPGTTVIPTITATSPTSTAAMSPDSEDFDLGDDASADSNANRTTTLPSPFRKAERSQSTVSSHVSKSMTSSSSSSPRASGAVGFALHRSSSLPTLKTAGLSHQKRLVLTYRLESAMDILDTLKRRNKENSLSPRVYRTPRQVDAVRDFNSWTKVWNKEFKVAHAQ